MLLPGSQHLPKGGEVMASVFMGHKGKRTQACCPGRDQKRNCFANLATSLNRRFLFFTGSQKATVSRHDGNKI